MNLLAFIPTSIQLAAASLALGLAVGYVGGCVQERDKRIAFKGGVEALGHAAEEDVSDAIKEQIANKERTNAENAKLRSANTALAHSLRDARASRRALSTPASATGGIGKARVNWTELNRAIQQFDDEVSGIAEAGDSARIDLDSAKEWAHDATD